MNDNFRESRVYDPSFERSPSESWLFAQAVLGNPIPEIASPQLRREAKQRELERLATISLEHAEELSRHVASEATGRHERELLEWAAQVSEHAEKKLSVAQRQEAKGREAWRRAETLIEKLDCINQDCMPPSKRRDTAHSSTILEWDPSQPRLPAGTSDGGQWTKGGGGAVGILGGIIRRNQTSGDLTGIVTPGMIASSRLAATLQSVGRLPDEVAAAAAAGLVTGGKAVVNGSATAVKNVATLGLSSSQLELIGVTKEDRARGYDTAVTIATASGQLLIAVGTSGLATALSKGGTIARTASGALIAFDAAGNAVGTVQGAYDAIQNGLNLENGLKIAGGVLGLSANIKTARDLSRAASAAKLKVVEEYISKCPRQNTPTKAAFNQYEIAHTGPHNYTIKGGGADFAIDGYRGTTILEAKHVGDIRSSPFVPSSTCPATLRAKILNDERKKLEKVRTIIQSGETPFKSIEVITNTSESKALFEVLLKEIGLSGTVRLAI